MERWNGEPIAVRPRSYSCNDIRMRDLHREAIISALAGEASLEELATLKKWRAASGGNEEAYQRIARLWSASAELAVAPSTVAPPSAKRLIETAKDRADSPKRGSARRDLGHFGRFGSALNWGYGWSAAAAATLAVGFLLGFWFFGDDRERAFGADVFVTGVDEIATVMLQDETVVRLAPSTRLTILDLSDVREVSLVGRAYFAVTSDQDRPFRIRLGTGDVVEVLGTRFDVMSRAEDVQVAVAEGEVRLGTLGTRVNLGANEVARITGGAIPKVERVENVYRVIDWLGPFLAFESTPMREVAIELRNRFGVEIEMADTEIAERTVTGWFADQDPEEIIGGICRVVAATCTLESGVHRMSLVR